MSADVIIRVEDVKKYYNDGKVKALDGVSTGIRRGEVVVIIGPSGGGKSTLLRSLNLLEEPTEGKIFFEGADITDPNPCPRPREGRRGARRYDTARTGRHDDGRGNP